MDLNVQRCHRSPLYQRSYLVCRYNVSPHISPVLTYDFSSRCMFSTLYTSSNNIIVEFHLLRDIVMLTRAPIVAWLDGINIVYYYDIFEYVLFCL